MTHSKITRRIPKAGLTLNWFGGHGIHIYKHGREVELINVGNQSKDEATREEVIKKMNRLKNGEWKFYASGWE